MMSKHRRFGRKVLSLLLSAAMILSFSVTALADPADTAVITMGSASDVNPGDTVTVAATLSSNPGFASYALEVTYDHAAMTLTAISGTYGEQSTIAAPSGEVSTGRMTYVNDTENITENGPLVFFTFIIADNASGDYSVNMKCVNDDPGNICNYDEEDVPVTFVPGTISVKTADSTTVNGGSTVTKGGTYTIESGATGVITINTTEAVTLVGGGEAGKYATLSIDCAAAGANLTIQDLWISAPETLMYRPSALPVRATACISSVRTGFRSQATTHPLPASMYL